jgi:small acid-soluble spore protein H (minor)
MNANRVKQIVSSSADIEVTYNGASVWIDKLHEDEQTATVHLRNSKDEPSQVDITELQEM